MAGNVRREHIPIEEREASWEHFSDVYPVDFKEWWTLKTVTGPSRQWKSDYKHRRSIIYLARPSEPPLDKIDEVHDFYIESESSSEDEG